MSGYTGCAAGGQLCRQAVQWVVVVVQTGTTACGKDQTGQTGEDETMGILCMFLTRSGQYQLYCSAEILTLLTKVIIGLIALFSLLLC